jgi:hypothetical protein
MKEEPNRTIRIDLEYPRVDFNPDKIVVDLMDVRAADSIEISYDFDRDGWVIKMDKTFKADGYMEVLEEKQEVAFIPAWNQ